MLRYTYIAYLAIHAGYWIFEIIMHPDIFISHMISPIDIFHPGGWKRSVGLIM